MTELTTLQETMLRQLTKEHIPVTLFLMNGFQMRGIIIGFDDRVVVLVTEGRQQMIYKHAISTMVPAHPLKPMTVG